MNPTAHPLHWPSGWPRTEVYRREAWKSKITLPAALENVRREIRLLGGSDLIISSNCSLGNERPADPGIAVFFKRNKKDVAIPCDRWSSVHGNLQAIAKTVEALRGIERWGAKHMVDAAFRGFAALPAESVAVTCWKVLGVPANSSAQEIERAFKVAARSAHPDTGGSHEAMTALNAAREQALNSVPR